MSLSVHVVGRPAALRRLATARTEDCLCGLGRLGHRVDLRITCQALARNGSDIPESLFDGRCRFDC